MKTIIVAAGMGSRLWPVTQRMPKTLLPFGEGTILSQILSHFQGAGSSSFTIVVGFKGEMIQDYLRDQNHFGLDITCIENPHWERGNGVSVASARSALEGFGSAFLSMSDHLVHPDAIRALGAHPGPANRLLTDFRIDDVYDPEDATKVRVEGDRILEIGKELTTYNAVDCGVFRIDAGFMDALDEQIARGKESISDGARSLIGKAAFGCVPMPPHCSWIDIDTPDAYEQAIARRDRLREGSRPATGAIKLAEPR